PTVARLASIPHGTAIVAQGTASTSAGAPVIPNTSIRPFTIGQPSALIEFAEETLTTASSFRTAGAGLTGVTQAMVSNPNSVLQAAIAGQHIQEATKLHVSTTDLPVQGGGTANTAFLKGAAQGPNAVSVSVNATFWLETIEGSPAIQQLQYAQTVLLNFNGLSWPHITVATLRQWPGPASTRSAPGGAVCLFRYLTRRIMPATPAGWPSPRVMVMAEFFTYAVDRRLTPFWLPFGLRPGRDGVTLTDDGNFLARFGFLRLETPLANISEAHITRNYRWWTAVGARMSLADHGLTFGTNRSAGVCVPFREPVPSPSPSPTLMVSPPACNPDPRLPSDFSGRKGGVFVIAAMSRPRQTGIHAHGPDRPVRRGAGPRRHRTARGVRRRQPVAGSPPREAGVRAPDREPRRSHGADLERPTPSAR